MSNIYRLYDKSNEKVRESQTAEQNGWKNEGVLNMAASTRVLPIIDMSIKGTLRTQFVMTIISGRNVLPIPLELLVAIAIRTLYLTL